MSSFIEKIRNNTLSILEVAILAVSVLLITYQLHESNRITWLVTLEANSKSLSELPITDQQLQCIYEYDITSVDKECQTIIKIPQAQRKIILYLDEILDLFIEVIQYDDKYYTTIPLLNSTNQFMEFHKSWYEGVFQSGIIKENFLDHVDKTKLNYIDEFIASRSEVSSDN